MGTKIQILKQEDPTKKSHGIRVTRSNGETFTIPVIDVRDGDEARKAVSVIQKSTNSWRGSSFLKRSYSVMGPSYQNSHKRPNA